MSNFRALPFILVLATSGNPTFLHGQTTTPPPPPKVVGLTSDAQNPSQAFLTIIDSAEGGFKIAFPAKPTPNVIERNSSFGKNAVSTYSLDTSVASYAVTFTDFPTNMTDKYDLDIRFDAMRDAQAKRMSGRVISDSEFYFGTHYGRALVVENSNATLTLRALVVGPRLFVMIVQTPGKMSTQSQKLRSTNQGRVTRFFDSFSVTAVADAKTQPVELPKDFLVSVVSNTFVSKYFDVLIQAPANWIHVEREESEFVMELGKEEIKRTDAKLADHLTDENARILAMFSKKALDKGISNAILMVLAEKVPYPNFLPSAVADTYAKIYLEPTEKITKPVSIARINGVEFAWLETFDTASKLYQRIYFANRSGISFEISASCSDLADMATMIRAIESTKFVSK